jgi:hypothetical protein
MAFSKALVQPYRRNQLLIGAGWRGYFAPFNVAYAAAISNTAQGPSILDLQYQGPFNTNNPPAGWYDLGWINGYAITPQSKIGQIKTGYRGVVRDQIRGEAGEEFEFKFREFTRMAFSIGTGCQIYNLLKTPAANTTSPLGGSGATTYSLGASGYQPTGITATATAGLPTVFVPSGQGVNFSVNDDIVVDVDFVASAFTAGGFAGSNGTPIFPNNAPSDIDYIRKTSDFVGRVSQVLTGVASQDALVLSAPLMGGGSSSTANPGPVVPPAGSKIQKMTGWASIEGGTFIKYWSALFVLDTIDGDQFAQYYPRVAISQLKNPTGNWSIPNIGNTDMTGYEIDATMTALGFEDPLSGETIVCYRAFYPAAGSDPAI